MTASGMSPKSINIGEHSHISDQITMAARLDPENAEAVLGVVKGHALYQTSEDFAIGRCRQM